MKTLLTLISLVLVTGVFAQQQQVENPFGHAERVSRTQERDPEELADLNNSIINGRTMINPVSIQLRSTIQVTFKLELEVNDAGDVVDIEVYEQSGDAKLNELVLRSVKQQVKFSKLNVGYNTLHKYTVLIK